MMEIGKDFVAFEGAEVAEHSSYAKSKKVIDGPMIVPQKTDDETTNMPPVHAAIGAELALVQDRAYRLIASAAAYIRFSTSTGAVAIVGDIYLPANTPIIISTKVFSYVASVAFGGAGIIQAVEVK